MRRPFKGFFSAKPATSSSGAESAGVVVGQEFVQLLSFVEHCISAQGERAPPNIGGGVVGKEYDLLGSFAVGIAGQDT